MKGAVVLRGRARSDVNNARKRRFLASVEHLTQAAAALGVRSVLDLWRRRKHPKFGFYPLKFAIAGSVLFVVADAWPRLGHLLQARCRVTIQPRTFHAE